MLRSPAVHLEENNCVIVHKHATGVTLPTFLKTLGAELTSTCITLSGEPKRCTNSTKTLRVVINGEEVAMEELSYYELHNNDHILLNYGTESGTALRFKYNQVPSIPEDINKPRIDEM